MTERSIRVNIAIRGKFHYPNYVSKLAKFGIEVLFFYSHRKKTTLEYRLDPTTTINQPLSEFLVQASARIRVSKSTRSTLYLLYGKIWARQVLRKWRPCAVLHVIAHGHSLPVMMRARKEGAKIIAEVVNSHPSQSNAILNAERRRLGLPCEDFVSKANAEAILAEVRLADIVLAPSNYVRKSYTDSGVPFERIHVIPYAANTSRFTDKLRNWDHNEGLRILCVGAVSLRKGQLMLLEAVRQLSGEHISVTLVGTIDPVIEPLLKQYSTLFKHIRHVPNGDLPKLHMEHNIFVLPTLEEGMAVANCEAMASGMCVVTTNASGADEIITNGRNGIIIGSGSIELLRNVLQQLIDCPTIISRMGREAALTAKQKSNWLEYSQAIGGLYNSL